MANGCIVCCQVVNRDEYLLCSDCRDNGYMQDCNNEGRYIKLTREGPQEVFVGEPGKPSIFDGFVYEEKT